MWNILSNRAAVVLISVTCGCVLIYNAWSAVLVLALLILVVYACYSLLANDSLVSPQAYHALVYLWEAILELRVALDTAVGHGIRHVRKLWHSASRCYRDNFPFRMDRRRRNKSYQLSSETYASGVTRLRNPSPSPSPASRFSLIDHLSPIPHSNDTPARTHKFCYNTADHERSQQLALGKYTSTPVYRAGRDDPRNGDIGSRGISSKKISPTHTQNHTLDRGENITQFSPKGSPWGTSISPKMRPRPAGVTTVQTVAGPLLASTRYNIDPKVYTDVSSPGLTTRLTKYAMEASSKLTHQSQYGTGQFPKVNLNANPVPLLSTKLTKMRMPVTVRLAPPELTTRYSPPERQKILSNIRHTVNTTPNKSTMSVVQVLREISLKRHASREDITFDVAKKQRTEDREIILEEIKQKRSRDDSSKSEEDLSPQSKSVRPTKRTKTRSCYDILSSLSSSAHVSSGIKRKAVDFSRSGTPDFEKHFKSLESAQSNIPPTLPQSSHLDTSHNKSEFKEIHPRNSETFNKTQESPLIKGILKTSNKESDINLNKEPLIIHKNAKSAETDGAELVTSTKSVKLADKLFMRAEPERNEQLKLLVEEQDNIKAKFTTDDVEEIKREDIRNMRQTSMKARLQSMFDAISGKAESRINPDVVIQAEDVNAVVPTTCSVSCATLNSFTTTTNVNTTPISTAAVVPGGLSSALNPHKKPEKAYSVPTSTLPIQTNALATKVLEVKGTNLIARTEGSIDRAKVTPAVTSTVSSILQKSISAASSSITTASTFIFGKSATPAVASSSLLSFNTSISSNTITPMASMTATSSTSTSLLGSDKIPLSSAFVPISSTSPLNGKIETNNIASTTTTSSSTATITLTNPTFAFGANKLSASSGTFAQTGIGSPNSTSTLVSQSMGTSLFPSVNTNTASLVGFNSIANSTPSSIATTSAQTSLFNFGNNNIALPSKSSDLFGQTGNNVQSVNVFGNISNAQTTSSQDTRKSFNFTSNQSNTSALTTNSSFNMNTTATTTMITTTTTTTPSFGLSTAPTFSLGTSTTSVSSASKPLFVFGANSSGATITPVTTVGNTAVFGTRNNNAIPTFGVHTTTTVPQFGASVTTATPQFGAPTTTAPQFGAPTTTAPQFGTPTTTAPQFGTPTTIAPQFGTPTTTAPQFGASTTSTLHPTSTTTITNIFGATNSQTPVFGTAGTSAAGATSIFNVPKTTAASIFTATTNASSSDSATAPNLFSSGSTNANTSTTTVSSSVFGSGMPTIFGQTKGATSFSAGTGVFGSTSTTPSLFGSAQTTSAPTFGVANVSTSSTVTPVFDGANNVAPATFRASSAGTVTANAPAFGSTTGMFGSTDNNASAAPIFGANAGTPTAGAFPPLATSTFGGQNPANLTFGAANSGGGSNSSSTFGDNKSPFRATSTSTTGFGGSTISAFGAGANTNNTSGNTNSMFFGNNQKEGQQNAAFSFASNFNVGSNSSTTASSAPFQFGSTNPKPTTSGFNFTAPSTVPAINFGTSATPTFNPSTPGMFSIGSGSTAPRSRTIRTRKPR